MFLVTKTFKVYDQLNKFPLLSNSDKVSLLWNARDLWEKHNGERTATPVLPSVIAGKEPAMDITIGPVKP